MLATVTTACGMLGTTYPEMHGRVLHEIHDAPLSMRRAFLQGLADGDGSTSVKGRYLAITSVNNKEFIHKLMRSFDIETRYAPKDVVTSGMREAKKAAQIPMFRYAKSRLDASNRMIERIDNRRDTRIEPLEAHETKFILSLKKQGLSDWDTSKAFLDQFGTAIDERLVKRLYRKYLEKRKK